MPSVRNVLIVGSGAAGCAAAILFARDGAAVDLIEIKPDLSALGSGITVQGNALRVLRQIGVWDEVAAAGYEAVEANRAICVPGAPNKAVAALSRLVPEDWALALIAREQRRNGRF